MASCPTPNIQTFQQPKCPDPATSLQVTKRIFNFPRYRMQIVDTGSKIWAWLTNPDGDSTREARVVTDSTTTAYIRNARLSLNPFIVPERMMDAPHMRKAIESYANCTNRLLQAVLCVENIPFPTQMGTFVGVEMEDSHNGNITSGNGVRVFGPRLVVKDYAKADFRNTLEGRESQKHSQEHTQEDWRKAEKNAQATGQDVELLRRAEKTNRDSVEIFVPTSSDFRILLNMGDGYEEYEEFDAVTKGAHVWEGTLTLCQENWTSLGAIRIN